MDRSEAAVDLWISISGCFLRLRPTVVEDQRISPPVCQIPCEHGAQNYSEKKFEAFSSFWRTFSQKAQSSDLFQGQTNLNSTVHLFAVIHTLT